jgi:hypothetical protein
MEPPEYQVVVVRAWREAEGLRIRLIADGDSERHWVVSSVAEASDLLGMILVELLATPTGPDCAIGPGGGWTTPPPTPMPSPTPSPPR